MHCIDQLQWTIWFQWGWVSVCEVIEQQGAEGYRWYLLLRFLTELHSQPLSVLTGELKILQSLMPEIMRLWSSWSSMMDLITWRAALFMQYWLVLGRDSEGGTLWILPISFGDFAHKENGSWSNWDKWLVSLELVPVSSEMEQRRDAEEAFDLLHINGVSCMYCSLSALFYLVIYLILLLHLCQKSVVLQVWVYFGASFLSHCSIYLALSSYFTVFITAVGN